MNVERAVVEFGAEAVLLYRAMAETRHDNEISGSFLRSHVASRLHERFHCPVHIDRLYAALAIDMGVPVTPDLITFLGDHRAHVALYADGRPSAVIELKVFDETTPLPVVGSTVDKARMLQRFGPLQIFGRRDDLPDHAVAGGAHRTAARCVRRQHVCGRAPGFARPAVGMVLRLRLRPLACSSASAEHLER